MFTVRRPGPKSKTKDKTEEEKRKAKAKKIYKKNSQNDIIWK